MQEYDPNWFAWTMMGTVSSSVIFDLLELVENPKARELCIMDLTDPSVSDLTPDVMEIIEEGDCCHSSLDVYRGIKTPRGH